MIRRPGEKWHEAVGRKLPGPRDSSGSKSSSKTDRPERRDDIIIKPGANRRTAMGSMITPSTTGGEATNTSGQKVQRGLQELQKGIFEVLVAGAAGTACETAYGPQQCWIEPWHASNEEYVETCEPNPNFNPVLEEKCVDEARQRWAEGWELIWKGLWDIFG